MALLRRRRTRLALVAGTVLLAASGVALAANGMMSTATLERVAASIPYPSPSGTSLPATSGVALAMIGASLVALAARRAEWLAAVVGSAIATSGLVCLLESLAGPKLALFGASMRTQPTLSSIALRLLAAGILALSIARSLGRGRGILGAIAVPVGVAIVSISLLVATALHEREIADELDHSWARSVAIDEAINSQLEDRLAALRRLVRHWRSGDSIAAWQDDAIQHVEEERGLMTLAVLRDRSLRPELLASASTDPIDAHDVIRLSGHWPPPDSESLRPAQRDGTAQETLILTTPMSRIDGDPVFLFAELDLTRMLKTVLERAPTIMGLALSFRGHDVPLDRQRPSETAATVALDLQPPLDGWILTAGPTMLDLQKETDVAAIVGSFGALLGLLVAVTLWVADRNQTSRRLLLEVHEKLLATEERHLLAIAGSKDTIWDSDVRTGEAFFSERINEVLGYEAGELQRGLVAFMELLHPDDRARGQAVLSAHLRERAPYDLEYRLRAKAGDYRWFRCRGQAVWDAEGNPVRMAGSLTCIDDMKTTEQQLARARDAALEGARAKSAFLAMMSHEIRTPLNGIVGAASLLAEQPMTDQARQLASIVLTSSSNLLVIINDILDLSKIEAGRLDIERTAFDIQAVASTSIELLDRTARAKNIELRLDLDEDVPRYAIGDELRIRQILLNFVGNAVKFTEHGHVTLGARIESRIGKSMMVRFSVTDTGIGLSSEAIAKLFVPFSQADSSTTRKFGGTGLGLAICRRLAELMNGSVGVESSLGEGSTFWLRVPLEPASDPGVIAKTREAPEIEDLVPFPTNREGLPGRVLVAEDNTANQKIIELQLGRLALEFDIVGNGHEAVDAMRRCRFDVVLMDCQMPEMDGFAATEAIRRLGGRAAQTPIIAMTADAFAEDRERCLQAGMDDYLAKPVKFATLARVLSRWIQAGSKAA